MANTSNPLIEIVVKNKQNVIFNESVVALTSYNEQGVFDILPMHENFISIIKDKVIIHKKTGENYEIKLTTGVLKAADNKINIYLGPGEIANLDND